MKRLLCLLLSVMLCLVAVGGMAESESSMNRVLQDWCNFLSLQENLLSQESFALDQLLTYAENPTWENLVRARATTSFTLELLAYYGETPFTGVATSEDYAALIAQGMDIGDMESTINIYNELTVEEIKALDYLIFSDYLTRLMFYVYDQDVTAEITRSAQSIQEDTLLTMKEYCVITHYILLELPEDDAATLDGLARQYAPTIMGMYSQPFDTVNDVMNAYNEIIAQTEEGELTASRNLTLSQDALENVSGYTALSIEHLPLVLPAPSMDFERAFSVMYYWKDADGQTSAVKARMDIQELPNCFFLAMPDATLEDYQSYVVLLSESGYMPSDSNDTAALFALPGEIQLLVQWNEAENEMQISVSGGQVCFAPDWYILQTAE